MQPLTIIGSGLAGYTLAREFRKLDKDTPLRIITSDDGSFYSKPVLSNALSQNKEADQLASQNAAQMAEQLGAEIVTFCHVAELHRDSRQLLTTQGMFDYDRLVLAMGARPRAHQLKGKGAGQVLQVNSLKDYRKFRDQLKTAEKVVVLGAGLIGCEFANDLVTAGYQVDVVAPSRAAMDNVLPTMAADALSRGLADAGVNWHFGQRVDKVDKPREGGLQVKLDNGDSLEADLMLAAIGLQAQTGLADYAGLEVEHGIVTDNFLRTNDEHIYALGDCAQTAGQTRFFVQPLMLSARALAKTLAGETTEVVFPAMPVVVKTPSHPVAFLAPPASTGSWQEEALEGGVRALWHDEQGRLRGFALTGSAVAERQALVKTLGT